MIKQLIFSGNVAQNKSTIVDPQIIELVYNTCRTLNISGLKLYTDGGYLFVAEGSPDAVHILKKRYENHERLSDLTVLLETKIEQPEFTDFKICFRKSDARAHLPNCFILTRENLNSVLPNTVSELTKVLTQTFVRVNNLQTA